jgi:hypothetical protein
MFLCLDVGCAAFDILLYQTCWTMCFIANYFLVFCCIINDALRLEIVSKYGNNLDKILAVSTFELKNKIML